MNQDFNHWLDLGWTQTWQLTLLAVTVGLAVWYGLNRTRQGKIVLAVIHSPEVAASMGVTTMALSQSIRIATIGEARGLAALVLRGQGKVESRGLITDDGLQPLSMRVERGGPDRVETAVFDWEAGIVTMHDNRTAPLDLPTFNPLSLI